MSGSPQRAEKTACILLGFLLSGVLSRAQSYPYLYGVIHDPSDAAVPGASISVVNQDTGFRRETRSQSDGSYAVVSLEPGSYKITVRRTGFRTLIRLGVRLGVAQPARVDFALTLGSMQESITVEGATALLQNEDASVGTVIGRDEIEQAPLEGHNLLGLLEFTPGVIVTPATRGEPGQFTSGGQRPNSHSFSVDGVNANTGVSAGGLPAETTGGSLPATTALGSLHSLLSLEAIDEFRVETSTTSPEFGRLPGAQITLSSRSGSNDFHGSVFDYLGNEALNANDWFSNRHGDERAPMRMNDFGGSLGGPVRRNRTFFFLSHERMRLEEPFALRAAVPDAVIRQNAPGWVRPLLDLFPSPNGAALGPGLAEWTGQLSRPSRFDAANLRADHALTSRITLFARYNQTPSRSEFNGAQVNRISMDSRGVTLGVNMRLAPSLVLDVRMNNSQANLSSLWGSALSSCGLEPVVVFLAHDKNSCDYLLRFSIAGVGQVISGAEAGQQQSQWHVAPAAVITRGSHQIRLGGDYLRLSPARRDNNRSLGVIADNLENMVSAANLWMAVPQPQSRSSVLTEGSAFFEDTWRIHPRLTASLGLRWEFTPPPEFHLLSNPFFPDPSSQPSFYLFSNQKTIWQRTYTNLAPRFGLAYRPSADSQTVLRAGWGIYYDSSLSLATDFVNGGPFSLSQFVSAAHAPFSSLLSYGFMPGLRLPSVEQWSGTVEHLFGRHQVLSASYEGAQGRLLLRRELGGFQDSETLQVALATNDGRSGYHALDLQYRLRWWRGLSGLVSYAWSHSIDNGSSDSLLLWAGSGLKPSNDRGSSDFDVRHSLTAAISYDIPRNRARSSLLHGWALDGIVRARTGFPISVLNADYSMGLSFANVFRPDLVPGEAIWTADPSAPGGRRLNSAAFQSTPDLVQGNLGRNTIAGFGMYQIDLALRRDFRLSERQALQLRIETFNLLNHPDFADPVPFLASPLFGQPVSMLNMMLGTGSPASGLAPIFQSGGARSVQVMLRFRF